MQCAILPFWTLNSVFLCFWIYSKGIYHQLANLTYYQRPRGSHSKKYQWLGSRGLCYQGNYTWHNGHGTLQNLDSVLTPHTQYQKQKKYAHADCIFLASFADFWCNIEEHLYPQQCVTKHSLTTGEDVTLYINFMTFLITL